MRFFVYILTSLLLLAACAPVPVEKDPAAQINPVMGRSAIVTTGKLNLNRNKPSTLSWVDAVEVVGGRDGASTLEIQQQIAHTVQSQIVNKGYPVVRANGDFQLYARVVLAGDIDSEALMHETGGIDPGLVGGGDKAGKGSLVIDRKSVV